MRATGWARCAAVALMAALIIALAGCGGSGSGDASGTPTGAASTSVGSSPVPAGSGASADPGADPCPYLTAQQVTDALGAPTAETAGSTNACFFDPEVGDGPSAMVSKVDVQIDPKEYATQNRALCQGDVTDVDAGDDAFACLLGLGPTGQVYLGRVLITVSVTDADDDVAGLAAAADLLSKVVVPPSQQ